MECPTRPCRLSTRPTTRLTSGVDNTGVMDTPVVSRVRLQHTRVVSHEGWTHPRCLMFVSNTSDGVPNTPMMSQVCVQHACADTGWVLQLAGLRGDASLQHAQPPRGALLKPKLGFFIKVPRDPPPSGGRSQIFADICDLTVSSTLEIVSRVASSSCSSPSSSSDSCSYSC